MPINNDTVVTVPAVSVPEVAVAMQAIFDAVEPLKAWLNPAEEE